MNDIQVFEKSDLLCKEDFQSLMKLQKELEENFEKNQIFRSRYEMESIINDLKFPGDSKYWQAIREEQVHLQELILLNFEYQKNLIKIELLESQIEELRTKNGDRTIPPKIKLKEIEIEQLRYMLLQQQRVAQDRVREVTNWAEIITKLEPNLKYSKDTYEEHQPESYFIRHNNQLKALSFAKKEFGEIPQDMSGFLNIVGNFDNAQKKVGENATG